MSIRYFFKSISYIINRFFLRRSYLIGRASKYGIRLKFKTEDGGGRKIYKKGVYEEELSDYLLKNLKPKASDVYLDIGANVGWYTLLISQHYSGIPRILSFEPDSMNYACLKENLKINRSKNVEPHQLAVSDIAGFSNLNRYKNSNTGRHSILEINDGEAVKVEKVALDNFLRKSHISFKYVKFIKIDIEGYELSALRGALKLLEFVPLILSEYSPGYMRKGGLEPENLLDLLLDLNFKPHLLVDGNLASQTKPDLMAIDFNINLFWIKNN